LLNLLSNAAKFTRNGVIRIELDASHTADGWRLHFACIDSGVGIDRDKQANIFQRFQQLTPNEGGVGLGLYIAQRIVKSMGGELRLQSAAGTGSQFNFDLVVAAPNDDTVVWAAPFSSLIQSPIARHALPTHSPTQEHLASNATGPSMVLPPPQVRATLAKMARLGHLTEIEEWLATMSARFADCAPYFDLIQNAVARLDLDDVERLANVPRYPANA